MARAALFIIFLVLQLLHLGSSRSVKDSNLLISDGLDDKLISQSSSLLQVVDDLKADTVTCEPIYGFLPCATSVWGLAFMVIVYEILLYLANSCITSGSELFFKMYGTGFFGASVFHLLGTIPQVGIVVVTGVTGTAETAEAMATMNIGMVAGSAIMLLTLVWGSVVAFGSYDISKSPTSSNRGHKKRFSITGYVTTDAETSCTARIMMVSLIPFLILQVAKVLNSTSGIRIVILISLLVSFAFLVAYCIYQVFEPWIQNRRLEFLMSKYVQRTLSPSFLTASGEPNVSNIQEVFTRIDQNHNQSISAKELRTLILGIQIGEVGLESDYVEKAMEDFDISGDSQISEQEFVNGISKWVNARPSVNRQGQGHRRFLSSKSEEALEGQQKQVARKKKSKLTNKSWTNQIKAACLLILGIGIMILLANPLMETIQDFSTAASIPSFFTSYVLIPLAINYGLALQIITSAQDKTENAISLALSEIYNSVFMNNVMGLTIFLALVYIRNLSWDVSAAVLVVLIICSVMGLYASFSRKFPFWTCIIAYIMYPISLLMVYILTTFLGWT
ncbi:putative EF-hand domain pair protein [Rosa chinensis]|uniref:Putative EF-hand domain pair protein n=1 Tax=Rosa chinensis TaxID=74649 RepID=A0A2P6Q4G5_ROSCH|nr:sodium/calcium exchanger NCL1 [Rosa chinensis]PRQ29082.1 putative EF-hand domain pair protein [Rosa chinensis]